MSFPVSRRVAIAVPTALVAGAVVATAVVAPASAASPVSYSRTTLSPHQTKQITGFKQHVTSEHTRYPSKGVTEKTVVYRGSNLYPYQLASTSAYSAGTFKQAKRALFTDESGQAHIVTKKYNKRTHTGKVVAYADVPVTQGDSTVTVRLVVVGRLHNKVGVYSALAYVEGHGSMATARKKTEQATAMLAKKYRL